MNSSKLRPSWSRSSMWSWGYNSKVARKEEQRGTHCNSGSPKQRTDVSEYKELQRAWDDVKMPWRCGNKSQSCLSPRRNTWWGQQAHFQSRHRRAEPTGRIVCGIRLSNVSSWFMLRWVEALCKSNSGSLVPWNHPLAIKIQSLKNLVSEGTLCFHVADCSICSFPCYARIPDVSKFRKRGFVLTGGSGTQTSVVGGSGRQSRKMLATLHPS